MGLRFVMLLLSFVSLCQAQVPAELTAIFEQRRNDFLQKVDAQALVILPGAPEVFRNLDVNYPFRQESNFYYLTGLEEPDAILVLRPFAPRYRFVLFVRSLSPRAVLYEGEPVGVRGAMALFGADTAFFFQEFPRKLPWLLEGDRPIYYTFGIHPRLDHIMVEQVIRRRSRGNYPIVDPHPMIARMRLIKGEGDWKAGFQKAIDISVQAHLEAMKAIRPGMGENEVQAVFQYVYRKLGSPRDAYPPIIGSGPNSCVLHYSKNNRIMQDGDVVLMDCGAEFGYYAADITRTVPVNGRFTPQQKQIYQLVLRAQEAAIQAVRPGLVKTKLDSIIEEILGEGLLELGFIKRKEDFYLFTLHKYAHWLGMDVHDVGGYTREGQPVVLQPGMVFTVEPGIYVRPDVLERMKHAGYSDEEIETISRNIAPYLHIGVRIEDDILVTETGAVNLTSAVPRTVEAIEQLMSEAISGE